MARTLTTVIGAALIALGAFTLLTLWRWSIAAEAHEFFVNQTSTRTLTASTFELFYGMHPLYKRVMEQRPGQRVWDWMALPCILITVFGAWRSAIGIYTRLLRFAPIGAVRWHKELWSTDFGVSVRNDLHRSLLVCAAPSSAISWWITFPRYAKLVGRCDHYPLMPSPLYSAWFFVLLIVGVLLVGYSRSLNKCI